MWKGKLRFFGFGVEIRIEGGRLVNGWIEKERFILWGILWMLDGKIYGLFGFNINVEFGVDGVIGNDEEREMRGFVWNIGV